MLHPIHVHSSQQLSASMVVMYVDSRHCLMRGTEAAKTSSVHCVTIQHDTRWWNKSSGDSQVTSCPVLSCLAERCEMGFSLSLPRESAVKINSRFSVNNHPFLWVCLLKPWHKAEVEWVQVCLHRSQPGMLGRPGRRLQFCTRSDSMGVMWSWDLSAQATWPNSLRLCEPDALSSSTLRINSIVMNNTNTNERQTWNWFTTVCNPQVMWSQLSGLYHQLKRSVASVK